METYWVPGVNNLGSWGHWAFAEFSDVHAMEAEFGAKVEAELNNMVRQFRSRTEIEASKWLAEAGGSEPDLEHIPRRRSEPVE